MYWPLRCALHVCECVLTVVTYQVNIYTQKLDSDMYRT